MLYLLTGVIEPDGDGEIEIARFAAAGDAYEVFQHFKVIRKKFRALVVYKLDKRGRKVERLYLHTNEPDLAEAICY